jgi:hypothetical protein
MSCFVPFLRSWTILGTPEFKSGTCSLPKITTTFADLFSESMRTILKAIPLSHADSSFTFSKPSVEILFTNSLGMLRAYILMPFSLANLHKGE